MIRLNIHEAKTHLSKHLKSLAQGETIILCKRNVPIAEIRPIAQPINSSRPIGLAKGQFKVTDSFFESLPDELVDAFYGIKR
ncbi:MAG: type II toxin-antitoxin system Phd/YefM family antitoxin [Proteobacteria bacterium]|nr:type II toxin-antitoxin system Phd/YefM family antitoxin [Pseudomonadota bacterium]